MNINIRLSKNFTTQYNRLQEKYGEEFARLQGLSDEKLSFTDFIDSFVDSENVAANSIDANSNIAQKDIVTLISEMSKPHKKILAFNKIYHELNKKYGFKEANRITEALWNYSLYLHDFDTSTFYSYCFAYDIKDIVEKGLFFIEGYNAQPPKHLDSFIQILMEAIAFLSRRQSGAVGLPNLIPYMYWLWKRDCENEYFTKTPEIYRDQQIQALIYRLNQPWIRQDQCAFTNVSVFDHPYFEAIFGGSLFPDGTPMIDYEEEIIEFQKEFIRIVNEIREVNIFTFPVLTASLLYQNNKFVDEEFAMWACEANMKWNIFNFFTDSTVNSLSNCCRLKSDITDLYFNSIGGTALKVGSIKVCTLNLARLAYQYPNEKEYLVHLKDLTEDCLKALDVIRHIIRRNVEKGLLPNFSYGLIDFEHCYNTVGIMGIYETIKSFGYLKYDELGNTLYTQEAFDFGQKIFKVIRNTMDNFILDKDYRCNLEEIPGEQAAVKMQKSDKLLFPDQVVEDLPLYGNQWIPLGIKTSLKERTRICAAFDQFCNGGSIEHLNIEGTFTNFEQAWELLNWVAAQGVTYFAFNAKVSQCANYHSFYGHTCPICGEPAAFTFTRTVGYYTKTATWSPERQEEFKLRKWKDLENDKRIED